MNIYDYIDEYGIYSFAEKEFNEVDGAIFSFLSYADFSNIFETRKMTIQEIGRKHFGMHPGKDKNIIAVREGNRILRYIKDTKRYKDCIMYNYVYEATNDIQFGVIAIEYKKNEVYISYEGTDEMISGWKENLLLSYQFPTKSHHKAISYLNKNFTFSRKSLILGGHSKGGNLALVAGMYANFFVQKRIKHIYNFDGPGLLEEAFKSKQYQNILNKYTHILPDFSVVGLLLNNSNDKVVKSTNKTILSHDIVYWLIEKDSFKASKLSTFSKQLNKEIDKWLSNYSNEERAAFVDDLDEICTKAHVTSFLDFTNSHRKIIDLIYESKDLDSNSRKILMEFIIILIKCINNNTQAEIKELLNAKIKIPFKR